MRDLDELKERLRAFARDRDWEQYHSPKNLSMALIVEAAELVEHFQWLTEAQSRALAPESRAAVEQEVADVFIYLVRLADLLGIDLMVAAERKIGLNEKKYPADRVRGSAAKYHAYAPEAPGSVPDDGRDGD
ncbi:nucleotide pyrophosphohydrolase [Sulfurifustis variabilis]|uniref:Nucleotide pyrophosphohydrolase n=1 Tax=Sulfurifustis variabilis TaxID=1675686 RepID=A0A1B4V0U8_9GAMM|nr:nucleotide pyrophosphohydrolase [Sulfurifustis variabilis]BAU47090.1 nucleotide pyrophosphohydrolase [Sulfurifustis variabilis]